MRILGGYLIVPAVLAGVPLALVWVGVFFSLVGIPVPIAVTLDLLLLLFAAWAVYTYLRYQQARRAELLQLLAAAVESGVPLAPAVRAHLGERPTHAGLWAAALAAGVVLLPIAPWGPVVFLRLWWTRFDRRAGQFADALEDGAGLAEALREVPGVSSTEAKLAAAVGEDTGHMLTALGRADRPALAAAWVEVLPQFLYPLCVLFFVYSITTFLMVMIIPKFKKIFDDFGLQLPAPTRLLLDIADWAEEFAWLIPLAVNGVLLAAVLAVGNPSFRWWLPGVGRLYRWEVRGQVLRLLGFLVEAGRPAPAALRLLAEFDEFPRPARRRLRAAAAAVERGDPLADALRRAGFVSAGMAPLVRAAEPAGNLGWALTELGDQQGGKSVRVVRRLAAVVGPVLVVLLGLAVEFIALSMFVPLIKLLEGLSRD